MRGGSINHHYRTNSITHRERDNFFYTPPLWGAQCYEPGVGVTSRGLVLRAGGWCYEPRVGVTSQGLGLRAKGWCYKPGGSVSLISNFARSPPFKIVPLFTVMGATGLVYVYFVVINSLVLSASRVDLGFLCFIKFYNFTSFFCFH